MQLDYPNTCASQSSILVPGFTRPKVLYGVRNCQNYEDQEGSETQCTCHWGLLDFCCWSKPCKTRYSTDWKCFTKIFLFEFWTKKLKIKKWIFLQKRKTNNFRNSFWSGTPQKKAKKIFLQNVLFHIKNAENNIFLQIMDQTKGRFSPDVPFIKKSIEDLIEKMYIQRTDQNDEYQYLA